MNNHFKTDIAIIGAGPSGLFAVFEAGMLKMKCHVIDTLDMIGGQCSALYPEKPIYDIPAYPQIMAQELIDNLEKQIAPFNPIYHLSQRVEKLERKDQYFILTTSSSNIIEAKAIVIAAGCGAFGPNRPPLENIESFEGKSVFYMVGKREEFRDKKIAIAGGGDSAIDWAISLAEIAEKIYLIHRRNKFKCAPESLSKINNLVEAGKIEMVVPFQLHSITGDNGKIDKLIVSDLDNNKKELEVDCLLPFFGLSMELGPIANWGLNLDKHHISVNPATMETSEKGIFAVGDIIHYPGKLKLILAGFTESAMAAYSCYNIVYPNQALHFEYSTSKGIEKL